MTRKGREGAENVSRERSPAVENNQERNDLKVREEVSLIQHALLCPVPGIRPEYLIYIRTGRGGKGGAATDGIRGESTP